MSVDGRPCIGLVHALYASIEPIEAAFAAGWPEAETISLYDQSLYAEFSRTHRVGPGMTERVATLLRLSAGSGADAVLFTGSLFGEAVEAARATMSIPVLGAYEAMIEEAFAVGARPRLGLLATVGGTATMLGADIERHARTNGREYALAARHVDGAMDALLAGDRARHDALVEAAAAELADCEVLLLAQFSMAPVAARLRTIPTRRVLDSPGCAVARLRRMLGD